MNARVSIIVCSICLIAGFLLCNLVCTPATITVPPIHTNTFVQGSSYFDTLTKTNVRVDTLRDTLIQHEYSSAGFTDSRYATTPPNISPVGFNLGSLASLIVPAIAKSLQDTTQSDGHVLAGFKLAFHPITAKLQVAALASIDINKFTAFVEAGYLGGLYFAVGLIVYLWKLI